VISQESYCKKVNADCQVATWLTISQSFGLGVEAVQGPAVAERTVYGLGGWSLTICAWYGGSGWQGARPQLPYQAEMQEAVFGHWKWWRHYVAMLILLIYKKELDGHILDCKLS
jgi:hypothetical protein